MIDRKKDLSHEYKIPIISNANFDMHIANRQEHIQLENTIHKIQHKN